VRRAQRLQPGRVLASGTRVWLRRFVRLHALALVNLAPLALAAYVIGQTTSDDVPFPPPLFVLGLSGLLATS
jgi:hypothetical protein